MRLMHIRLWVLTVLLSLASSVSADDFEVDGIRYRLTNSADMTVSVTYINGGYSGEVIIPESVNYLGKTYNVTSIDSEAFSDCRSLTSVIIGNSVTYIGDYAFYGCISLTSVTIPKSVTKIGYCAFGYCSSLLSVNINCKNVGSWFSGSSIKDVGLGDNVTSIDRFAFSSCTSLTSMTIPNSVTSIGEGAFENCSALTSVTIPNSVTSIGERAFRGCSSLASMTIPNSVTSIGDYAFDSCQNLIIKLSSEELINSKIGSILGIEVPKGYTTKFAKHPNWNNMEIIYAVENGVKYCPVILEEEGNKVVHMKNGVQNGIEVAEAESITISLNGENADNSFIMVGYTDITETIRSKKNYSFTPSIRHKKNIVRSYAYPQKDIHVLTSGTLINQIGIENVNNILSLKVRGNLNGTDILAIRKMTNLKLLDLKDASITDGGASYYRNYVTSEKSIGDYFFLEKESLIIIVLPENTEKIKQCAFSGCSNLKTILIPKSVKEIEDGILDNCNSLVSITFLCPIVRGCEGRNSIGEVFLGEGVTSIDGRAFDGCSALTSVTIPNSVTSIDDAAFRGCSSLTSMTIPNSVTSIGREAFQGCSSLISMTIPNSVTKIEWHAFENCSALTSVSIPNSVKSIDDAAFRGCSSLKSVTIPNSVKSIGKHSFSDCDNLSSFIIEDGNSELVMRNVSKIYNKYYYTDYNFENTFLKEVYIGRTVEWEKDVYVTSMFGDRIETAIIGQNVTSISGCTFLNCKYLTSIIIPNSVTNIGWHAFENCSSLTSVTIPNGVTSFTWGIFSGCSRLASVTIPNSVTSIDLRAFENCSALTSVTIPNSVTSIGDYAFRLCNNLTSVTSLNTTPPAISYNTFDEETYSNATLRVPFGCKTVYWLNPNWENFMNIVEIDASDVNEVIADTPNQESPVYNLQGVKRAERASDLEGLPKGIYIINGKKYTVK